MTYWITGCAGFIGSHLCETLLTQGKKVTGSDCFTDYYDVTFKKNNLKRLMDHPNFRFIEADLLHMDIADAITGVNCVFHTAGQPGVRASWGSHFDEYVNNNVLATQRLLETIRELKSPARVVYSSSSSIYGNTADLPMRETSLPKPYSPYGMTKLAAEHLCHLYHANYGIPVVSLRYFTVYGPRQRPDMFFHILIKALLNNDPIHIFGDGKQTRDFTFVQDIVQANLAAAEKPVAGEVFNIGGGSRVSLIEVLETLERISGIKPNTAFEEKTKGDVKDTWADTSKAQKLLGYMPKTTLDEGLLQEYEWAKELYG